MSRAYSFFTHPMARRMKAPSVRIVLPTTRVSVKSRSKGKSSTILMAPRRSRPRAMIVLPVMFDPGAQKTTMAPCAWSKGEVS